MKRVPRVGTVTVEDTDDECNQDTADDELSGTDDDHPPPRLLETVLRIMEVVRRTTSSCGSRLTNVGRWAQAASTS